MSRIPSIVQPMLHRPVSFYPLLARMLGSVTAALMLSQGLYWSGVQESTNDKADGWFYKTQREWEEETCLTRHEQDGARKILRGFAFWQEERRDAPAKMHYRIDLNKLAMDLSRHAEKRQTRLPKTGNLECGKTSNKIAENRRSLKGTESTTEITSGCARSGSGKKITEQPQQDSQKRAESNSLPDKLPAKILAEVNRAASGKALVRSDPELEQLRKGIFRERVKRTYFACRHLEEEEACSTTLDDALLDLWTNRGTVELGGVSEKELRDACWERLARLVPVFAALADYSRRESEVLGAILRIVCEEALRLKRAIGDAA